MEHPVAHEEKDPVTTTTRADAAAAEALPLCVDLSESLVAVDLPAEALFARLRKRPSALFRLPFGGAGDERARDIDVEFLPWNEALLEELRAEKANGRTLVLVAQTDERTASVVAGHLGLFDEVVTHGGVEGEKATALRDRFGRQGFEFVGAGSQAGALDGDARTTRVAPPAHPAPSLRVVLRALRVHQWLKNVLIFLPVLAGQRFTDGAVVLHAVLAFVAFSLVASSVYVVNDLFDLREDRKHARKRQRPFASGQLPLNWAPFLVGGMLTTASLITALLLPLYFAGTLAAYLVLTLAYSLKLKGAVLVDVFILAALYTLRVIAGSAATGIEPSVWLLGFCMFFFLSLALVKRYAELHALMGADTAHERLPGRSYRVGDLPVLVALGVATGCMSVLVLALYVISDEFARHYTHPFLLWQLCPLALYWIARAWMVVARDEMHDDPLVWAVKDQLSRWVGIAAVGILLLAR